MYYNQPETKNFIISLLDNKKIKYSINNFESGIIMIDIWFKRTFYVVQLEQEFIGFSVVDDINPGFDTVPEERFENLETFKIRFNELFE